MADYAKQLGISYQTAWRHFKAGKIPYPTRQLESGTVIVDYDPKTNKQAVNKAAIYARVSSAENKDNLDRQAERLTLYAAARGYQVQHIVKEVGSGFFENRKKLENLLKQNDYQVLIVENKDRLSFLGTHYIDILLSRCGVTLEVVNMTENGIDELMNDFVGIINFVTTRLYGQREAKEKTKKIIATLQGKGDNQEL
ncbi:IS607 family transposase [Aetokthonos hydrillicola Thurmond2011]|uniref:IS607 family transposase n=1 Tax=Aetokthonos hydrillicola Thurmond2011 TaxID=2712845 RepID=A0AAP5MAE7_9CYAN|nr:IS607 family transposase [Aetokthonos hydrillicola]MBW4590792.1 IS607 family transposase [Aetokthonos hydrillicola CCALA 1050]MDR9898055.1 IS607 family transposase [Aetokthonos hydrillicola Thurmond2011]